LTAPRWIYLSSVGEHSTEYHREIADYLKKHTDTKLAFQPGTYQIKGGIGGFRDLYRLSKIFFCNAEEAKRILGIIENEEIPRLLKRMHDAGPETVVITDGPKGAYAYDGVDGWFMPPYPDPKPPYDRTGAGDSFSSTVTAALALGKPLHEALLWGPVNSMSVVQKVGAQKGLLTREALEGHLAKAPANYKPIKIF
jgi:ribokinase